MAKCRKSDEFYIDQYDRSTIETLKELEQKLIAETRDCNDPVKIWSANTQIDDRATALARNKRAAIEQWKHDDQLRDDQVMRHPVPRAPSCECGNEMEFFDYDFIGDHPVIHFIFTCGTCKRKSQILDQYGARCLPKAKTCSYCNGIQVSKVSRTKKKIKILDTCEDCGKQEVLELEIPVPKKILPVDESERAVYCIAFEGRRTFFEDLKALADLAEDDEVKPDLSKIQMLKLPQLEKRLSEFLEKNKYIKLVFQQPKISDVVTVMFSVEDITDRDDHRAAKELKKIISSELQRTNWRLMSTGIVSRMGYLSGQLKGFDRPEHLNDLIRETEKKTVK